MANQNLKFYAQGKGVRLWQVAEKFGVSESYFSRKLRREFSEEESDKFRTFVDEIAERGNS
jgi:AraC-like DNA-binding protein